MKTLEKLSAKGVQTIGESASKIVGGLGGATEITWVSDHGDHCCQDGKPDPKTGNCLSFSTAM